MTVTKEYMVGIAQGAGIPIAPLNKRIRVEQVRRGDFELVNLVVQADAYEISISGALTILAGRVTVIALAPGTWTAIQPIEMGRT